MQQGDASVLEYFFCEYMEVLYCRALGFVKESSAAEVIVQEVFIRFWQLRKNLKITDSVPGIQLFADGWSKITKDYKITGIPRFMVFAKDGSIVEARAPPPSDPSLQKMIENELRK